ncbi:response regulator [Lusitaniella coriacea LEGE 07157]|uniref:Circadian input-output histidine kinase CikA n=1 Tax=Lusitaniella coriacea LEGE 07157 TaxID=945747 RepID=A0A8J7IUS7_9CYAN|nr:response regulator [Lusitaniella coriacea]MBE9117887.1 response regulator [Lusitaniella coriacea LEGE 07157]
MLQRFYNNLSLKGKIFLPLLSVFLGMWVVGTLGIGYFLTQRLGTLLEAEIEELASVVQYAFEQKQQLLSLRTRWVADNNNISQFVAQKDRQKLLQTLLPMTTRFQIDFVKIVDNNGAVLVELRQGEINNLPLRDEAINRAAKNGVDWVTTVTPEGDVLSPVILAELTTVKSPQEIVGGIIVGLTLSDKVLQKIRAQTHQHLALFHNSEVVAATLPDAKNTSWQPPSSQTRPKVIKIAKETYFAKAVELSGISADAGLTLVLLNSTTPLEQSKRQLWAGISVLFLVGAGSATVLLFYSSRAIARPLQDLTAIAYHATQESNFTVQVPIKTHDEVGVLGKAFNQLIQQVNFLLNQQQAEVQRQQLLAQELQHTKEKAEAANRAKSEFLANMSHELRTPLNAILGFTQIILRGDTSPQEQRNYIEIVNRSGEHLLSLINDILAMSKIEAGKIVLNPSNFDLYRLLDTLEEMFRLKTQAKSLQLLFERAPDIPQYLKTDESKLRQVLINLLSNAIKFTQEGGIALRVGLSNSEHRDASIEPSEIELVFEVEDTGAGINSDEITHLFEAFSQTESGLQSNEGTGLGLPISQKFVELMGGEMTVQSTPDYGSLFRFNIKAARASLQDIEKTHPQGKVIGIEQREIIPRILIVEDKPVNRQLLTKLLTTVGLDVREANNGKEGIELWESWKPHLIWMDMRMPVMDGYEATRRIKAHPQGKKTIIVALTASALEEERAEILETGCDDFVRKPFREAEIFNTMATHLNLSYIYQEDSKKGSPQESKETLQRPLEKQLQQMPSEWIEELKQAAIKGLDDEILQLIEKIPEDNGSLAETLRDWTNDFDFDAILDLNDRAKI